MTFVFHDFNLVMCFDCRPAQGSTKAGYHCRRCKWVQSDLLGGAFAGDDESTGMGGGHDAAGNNLIEGRLGCAVVRGPHILRRSVL